MQLPHRVLDSTNSDGQSKKLCALAIMTKAPRAGHVKTRLVPPLTPEQAAQLNVCFLRDTANAIQQACGSSAVGIGVYTPVGFEQAYIDILPSQFQLLAQRGDGFGDRLTFATEDLFRCGFDSVCLIDSDSPTVPAVDYAEAVNLLSKPEDRVILGPSDDGGYYLIGLKRNHRELFEGIDWSTERVFEQTRKQANELNLEVALLPNGYDVDDRASLERLTAELLGERTSADIAPCTREFLAALVKAEGKIFAPQ